MVDKEERSLEPIYIKNHDAYNYVCEYFPSSGNLTEKRREEIGEVEFNNGYYVRNKGKMIGLFSSLRGPIVFRDQEQYLLEYGKCQMELSEMLNDFRRFRLIIDGIEMLSVDYEKQKYINYDPWSDEDMVDFFLWLSKQQNDCKFYKFFTTK